MVRGVMVRGVMVRGVMVRGVSVPRSGSRGHDPPRLWSKIWPRGHGAKGGKGAKSDLGPNQWDPSQRGPQVALSQWGSKSMGLQVN